MKHVVAGKAQCNQQLKVFLLFVQVSLFQGLSIVHALWLMWFNVGHLKEPVFVSFTPVLMLCSVDQGYKVIQSNTIYTVL